MATYPPDITQTCPVDDEPVRLTVTIGDGQLGVVSVYLDGILLTRVAGGLGQLLLGRGAALRGRQLHVRTLVNDVLSVTNRMSVSYLISGCPSPCGQTHDGQVDNEGDQLTFRAYFDFV